MDHQPETEIKIERIASTAMLEQCAELFVTVFNSTPWNDKWTRETAIALFTCYYNTPKFTGWVATADSKLIGCALGNTEPHYSGPIFYLREMFVAAPLQKMGIGGRLIAAIKTDLHVADTKEIILFTRKSIFDYYIKFGFNEMEEMGMMGYICGS
ncbi:MAG: GNAT family N-acetyltransferase [Mucilaginibacter sp.]|uniref:GNAT family N-acetyltransferase n=1 Tax=Mucilaginibacter sp. TaxID=1882438 RepID=UPI003266DD56